MGTLTLLRLLQLLDKSVYFLLDVEVQAHVRREHNLPYRFPDLLHLIKTQSTQHIRLIDQPHERIQMIVFQDRHVVARHCLRVLCFLEV